MAWLWHTAPRFCQKPQRMLPKAADNGAEDSMFGSEQQKAARMMGRPTRRSVRSVFRSGLRGNGIVSHANDHALAPVQSPDDLVYIGRVHAITCDDRGRSDGFVLEFGNDGIHCFETRAPVIGAVIRYAFSAGTPVIVHASRSAPRDPIAVVPV